MIQNLVGWRPAQRWSTPTRAAAPPPDVQDLLTLSSPLPRQGWASRLRDWALGSTQELALQQAPVQAQVVEAGPALTEALRLRGSQRAKALPALCEELQPVCPAHVELARRAIRAASDDVPRGSFAVALLDAGRRGESLEQAALQALKTIPSDYPGNQSSISEVVVDNLPSLALTRTAFRAAQDKQVKNRLVLAGLQAAGQPPGEQVRALLGSIPSDYPGNRNSVSTALMQELTRDPELGPALQLAQRLGGACQDSKLPARIHQAILDKRMGGETNPGQLALAGIASIPSDYPSNRARVVETALDCLQDDPALGGYVGLGKRMVGALSDKKLATPIGLSVLESGLQNRTLAETARAAMEVIPRDYPANRNQVGKAVLQALSDSPDVQLARTMVEASDAKECQTPMILAALEIVTGEQKDPIVVTGQKLLARIPNDYPSNRAKVSKALLTALRVHYTDPGARARIDAALTSGSKMMVDEVLKELVESKTTVQEVMDLADALSGKEIQGGVEERGSVVVIGGVRVKVKKG